MLIINKEKIKISLFDILQFVVSIFLILGINFWFHACGMKADGTYMNCHEAEMIIKVISYIIIGLVVIKTLIRNSIFKAGISVGILSISLLMILIPKVLVSLCMYDSMACNKYMRPYTLMFGIIFIVISCVEIVLTYLKTRKAN